MRKNIYKCIRILFFLVIALVCIMIYPTVRADSGYDSSWDSGGSSGSYSGGSSGWSSSSSWDHSSSSSSHSYSSSTSYNDPIFNFCMLIVYLIILILIFVNIKKNKTNSKLNVNDELKALTDDYIKEKLGEDFDIQVFYDEVFKIYKDVQIAWMDRDIDRVRNILSDEMYNTYKSQADMLKMKKQTNVMEDIERRIVYITNINKIVNVIKITVRLDVTCYDYLIDDTNKDVLRGSKNRLNHYTYKLTFKKNIDVDNKCPKCGAELDNSSSVTCPYCKWNFVKNNSNFILVDKKMHNQYIEKGK